MIKIYSQRQLPPFYGQLQIAELSNVRAVTIDGQNWEIQYAHISSNYPANDARRSLRKSYFRVAQINTIESTERLSPSMHTVEFDDTVLELYEFIKTATLPFPARDHYEYWLLDKADESPLALIFSCCEPEQIPSFPQRAEWTALPASVMKIDNTEKETSEGEPPVNYRLERLVNKRAGQKAQARWFERHAEESEDFPNLQIANNWLDDAQLHLYERYIQRQSPRLLTLHDLNAAERLMLEKSARDYALEVERFCRLYPDVMDQPLMKSIRVEARLRQAVLNQSLKSKG